MMREKEVGWIRFFMSIFDLHTSEARYELQAVPYGTILPWRVNDKASSRIY